MVYIYLFLSLLFVFVTHRLMGREIAKFVHFLGGDKKAFITLWSAIFLPGTILHEVSHFLFATILGVRTGKIEVLPEFIEEAVDENSKNIHLGYVQVSKMNPIQGFFVGFAPFVTGSAMLIWLSTIIPQFLFQKNYWLLAFLLYIFFTIANSMFPSWQDVKQTLIFVIILILAGITFLIFGFRLTLTLPQGIYEMMKTLTKTFVLSGVFNMIIFLPFNLTSKFRR